MAEKDYWGGAAIALAGIVVGALITEARDRWKERATRRRVGAALATEIYAMMDVVATCASLANYAQFALPQRGEQMTSRFLISQLPPEPTAYRALAGQLPLLDIDTVSAIVAFYGSLELAKNLSTQHSNEENIPAGQLPILGNAWRAASRVGEVAFRRADLYAPAATNQIDVESVHELRRELIAIQQREWPRVERTDKGTLRIGRASVRARQA
jgi:hypothetical protein